MFQANYVRRLVVSLLYIATSSACLGQAANSNTTSDFPGLDIQAQVGWDGFIDQTAPLPISFLVTNQSEKLLEGELRLKDPISGKSLNLGELAIGPGGSKRFSTIQTLLNWESCFAEYTDGAQVFWTRSLSLANERYNATGGAVMLVIDDGGRKFVFPTDKSAVGGVVPDQTVYTPPVGQGHVVQALSIGSWQLPTHPGPLTTAQSAVLTESAKPESLNDAQWDAMGRWICMGGTLFIHESTPEVVKRAEKACPLSVLPAREVDGFTEHPACAGQIRVYRGRMFSGDDLTTPLSLATATSRQSRPALFRALTASPLVVYDSPASERTRNWVILVFTIYTLISGGVTFLLFRFSRSRLKIYTISVVTIASVAAAGLGVMLRSSRGDAAWNSVTQLTETGAVQAARIAVRSAGGRNFQLEVTGPKVDLQVTETDALNVGYDRYSYPYHDRFGMNARFTAPPFSLATNLSDVTDAFRIQVPVRPWGEREAIAVGFLPSVSGISVKLRYWPPFARGEMADTITSVEQVEAIVGTSGFPNDAVLQGTWIVEVLNESRFELLDCKLSVTKSSVRGYDGADPPYQRFDLTSKVSERVLQNSDLVHQVGLIEIGSVAPKESKSSPADASIRWSNQYESYFDSNSVSICYPGGTQAKLVAGIKESPGLRINESASDFRAGETRSHLVLLPIDNNDLPASWKACHDWLLQRQIQQEEQVIKNSNANMNNR